MSIVELKGGSRWVPGIGMNPDPAGLRRPPPFHSGKNMIAETAHRIAMLSPLIVSIALLATLLGMIYFFSGTAITATGGRFTVGDLFIPLAFFLIQLTSRRHGPARALAQLLCALVLCAAAMLADPPILRALLPALPAVTARLTAAFAIAFVLANCAGIAFFEAARGPVWWKAPAWGAAAAVLMFCGIFYPLIAESWTRLAAWHVAQLGAESALLLIPYWLLRDAIKPLPGLNGY